MRVGAKIATGAAFLLVAPIMLPATPAASWLPVWVAYAIEVGVYHRAHAAGLFCGVLLVWACYGRQAWGDPDRRTVWLLMAMLLAAYGVPTLLPSAPMSIVGGNSALLLSIPCGLLGARIAGTATRTAAVLITAASLQAVYAYWGYLNGEHVLVSGSLARAGGTYVWAEARVARLASKPIRAASCSRAFLDATVAMEDGRFYRHRGLDLESIHRALRRNVQARRIVQGGSTITQQVAKNLFLGPERTLRRKILEADLALVLERRLTKRQILSMYVSCVDYGLGCRGIEQAARLYFGKRPEELDLAESAVLVGLVPSPPQQFLSAEAINAGRRRALGRIAHFYPDRYTPAALNEAAMRPIEGWVRPYVTAEERGATADLPAVVGEVSFCSYLDPATARPFRHLHPDFARRIEGFARDARSQMGLSRIVHLGAYVDRFERGSSAKPSSHALGRALDIKGFAFDDGRVIEARPNADPKAAAKLDQVRRLLQKHFPRVLWWGNEPVRHHNHFHVELPADEADILAIMERANEHRIGAPP